MTDEQWTVADVAAYWRISPGTVRGYLSRGHMPPADGYLGRTPWWRPETIEGWERPGRGARTDLG